MNNWDTSNARNMKKMFSGSGYDFDHNNGRTNFNSNIKNWDVSNVTNMDYMFFSSAFQRDISNWCVSKITSIPIEFGTMDENYKPKWGEPCN